MKKIVYLSSAIIMLLLITYSCKKEFATSKTDENSNYLRQDHNNDLLQIVINKFQYIDRNGHEQEMLVFKSDDDYFAQLDRLDMLDDQHEQDFLNRHPNATEEEINRFDSIEQFNEYQVFLDFDDNLNFNGLIHNYIDAENEWLSHNDLPDNLDPDNIYFGLDENELAILNQDYAYMIDNGGKNPIIVKHYPDGAVIINDGSINTLNQISQYSQIAGNGVFVDGLTNVEVFEDPVNTGYCIMSNTERDYRTVGNNKRIKGMIKVKYFQSGGIVITRNKVKVKAKSIKRNWLGMWCRYRVCHIKAAVDGVVSIGDPANVCGNDNFIFNPDVDKKERSCASKVKYKKYFPNNDPAFQYNVNFENQKLWGYYFSDHSPRFKLDAYDGTFISY